MAVPYVVIPLPQDDPRDIAQCDDLSRYCREPNDRKHIATHFGCLNETIMNISRGLLSPEYGHWIALNMAATQGHLPSVSYLVDVHGADVNSFDGRSLHGAASRGHTAVVRLLLQNGANVGLLQASRIALRNNHNEIARLIEERMG